MKKILSLIIALMFFGCDSPQTGTPSVIEGLNKRHYVKNGLVVTSSGILTFATEPLPTLDCSSNPTWPYGYSSIPGVLDGFKVVETNGQVLARFNMTIFNSSTTQAFVITDRSGVDSHGDVTDFWQAELLDQAAGHLQFAGGKEFMRFVCYETRPMQCGFAPSQEYLTIAPQWADTYSEDMDDQYFDMTNVPTGRYIIRFNVDPLGKYGETQIANYNVTWDATTKTISAR